MSVLFLAGCVTFDSGSSSGSERSEVFPSGMQTSTSIIDELTPERKPECQTFDVSYDKTWTATLKVLKTLDNAITTTDKESGLIATDYLERPVTMFTDTWRDKYYVTVNKINASSAEVRIKRTVEKLEAVEIVRGSRIAG